MKREVDMRAHKKPGYIIEPIVEGPTARWEGHHATNPTSIRLSCDPRVFLGYRAGGDEDLYYLRDIPVWSSHLGLAVLDEHGGAVVHRFPLPIFTLDNDRRLPKTPEESEAHMNGDSRDEIVALHDFRFWEDREWLYVIYHEGELGKAFDCIVRMRASDFVAKVDESIELLEAGASSLEARWRKIWWSDGVWDPCGVNGTNRIYPSSMSKNDIVHLRLNDGTLLMYHRPVPDIAVVKTDGAPYPSATSDGITAVGHLQTCIRPGYRDNSHIGNNGMPIVVRIGDIPVAMDIAHGVYNEALSNASVTKKWKLLYYPYLRLLDLDTGQCLYYSKEQVLDYDETWEEYDKQGKWVSVNDHLDGVMFAGGTVAVDAEKNGLNDLYRSYIGVGDTAVAVADFRLRDILPIAVVDDIMCLGAHREATTNECNENGQALDGGPCGWNWRLANSSAGRAVVVHRELDQSGEHHERPIETRPGFFDADCLSIGNDSVAWDQDLGWIIAYTGCRWDEADGERSTIFGTGIVILDRNLPERLLFRSEEPIAGTTGVEPGWVRACHESPLAGISFSDSSGLVPDRVSDEIRRMYRLNPMPSDMIRWLERKSAAAGRQ